MRHTEGCSSARGLVKSPGTVGVVFDGLPENVQSPLSSLCESLSKC